MRISTFITVRMAVLAAVALTIVSAQETTDGCDLECETEKDNTMVSSTDGKPLCVKEEADFSDHILPDGDVLSFHADRMSPGGYHCVCAENWTGLKCRRKFEICSEVKEDNNHCYHNGKCENGQVDGFGNPKPFCDCNRAQDKNGTKHIGKYCVEPVVACTEARPIGKLFCLNDGDCKGDA